MAVYSTVKDALEGKFQAGIRSFGLDHEVTLEGKTYNGVGYALDEYNKDLVTQAMIAKGERGQAENNRRGRSRSRRSRTVRRPGRAAFGKASPPCPHPVVPVVQEARPWRNTPLK